MRTFGCLPLTWAANASTAWSSGKTVSRQRVEVEQRQQLERPREGVRRDEDAGEGELLGTG